MATADKLLCGGCFHCTGFALVGCRCLPSPSFGCVVCGTSWIVFWFGQKPATRFSGLGVFWVGSHVGQAQPLPKSGQVLPVRNYKVIYSW